MMRLFAVVLMGLAGSGACGLAADLSTLTGKKYKGEPVRFDGTTLTFRAEIGTVAIPVKEIFQIDFGTKPGPAAGSRYDELELTDGSILRCSSFRITGKTVPLTLLGGPAMVPPPTVELPLNLVFHMLRGADQAKVREDWKRLIAGRGKRDLFVSRSAEGQLSPLPGTLLEGNDGGDSVSFEREDGQKVTLQLRRATGGIIFNQPPVGVVPPTVCQVVDAFGNVLFARSIELKDGGLAVKTVHGATVTYPTLAGLSRLDFSQGNITYLSDLDPAVAAPKPIPGEPYFTFLRDKSQDNGPIRLGGQTYARGLWIAPETALTFRLTADYREFKAVIGVDDGIELPASKVKLTIEGDGRSLFSGIVSRKDVPKELVLDVKGVRELRISVDQEARFTGNQITLAEARLQK